MADECGGLSVRERIAALKLQEVGRIPGQPASTTSAVNAPGARARAPPPPPPARPSVPQRPERAQSSNVPPVYDYAATSKRRVGNQPDCGVPTGTANGIGEISRPALPPRNSNQASTGSQPSQRPTLPPRRPSESPALPPRRPSEGRRPSIESISSIGTTRSSISGISTAASVSSQSPYEVKAPAYDPSALPALPPKLTKAEKEKYYTAGTKAARRPLKSAYSTPNVGAKQTGTTPPPRRPSAQPPSIPTLTAEPEPEPVDSTRGEETPSLPSRPARNLAPPPPRKSALEWGLSNGTSQVTSLLTTKPETEAQTDDTQPQPQPPPPPIPVSSRPDLASLYASKPKLNGTSVPANDTSRGSCLHCRDFSGPDNHAARFPRESLPSYDIGRLAHQLTAPFDSLTDKARALFTWQHHNIAYNTEAFFNNAVKPSTPQSTLESGLAVCEGYAGLFAAMAMKAGLEAMVVSGHGKGYGHSQTRPGDPVPPYSAGHAWNAVKLDDGRWKLIDCCWGAGAVGGKGQPYQKRFAPERFTQTNDDFGLDHFPGDSAKQFRNDGRVVTWEAYITGNANVTGAQHYAGFDEEEGISVKSFRPVANPLVLAQQGPTVRFSFQKICPHWDPARNGKGAYYLYLLHVDALDGSPKQNLPFQTNGEVWWCDVPTAELGRRGQKVSIWTVTVFNGRDPARGLTAREFQAEMRSCGFGFVMTWEIA